MTKADELLDRLSAEIRPRRSITPTIAMLIGAGVAVAIAIALSFMILAPRTDLALAAATPIFLVKLGFAVSVAVIAFLVVRNLAIPGRRPRRQWPLMIAPFVAIGALAVVQMTEGHPAGWEHDAQHASLIDCLWQVGLLALPAFVVLSTIVRSMAPTNLAKAGLYVGLLSGAIGAFGYAFHCRDDFVLFVAIAYTLAMALMGVMGAALGPRILRW